MNITLARDITIRKSGPSGQLSTVKILLSQQPLAVAPKAISSVVCSSFSHFIMSPSRPAGRDDFEIAIICALRVEYDAVSYIFEEFWDEDTCHLLRKQRCFQSLRLSYSQCVHGIQCHLDAQNVSECTSAQSV
jgi:hypothetical protein